MGTVKAQNKQVNQYEFVDKSVNEGISYYRVVGVDNDGRKSYSEIRQLSIINYPLSIKVFPNPTNGIINVQLPENGDWKITATDLTGRIIWQEACKGCSNNLKYKLNSTKGLYFIKVINNNTGQQLVQKIILQ